MVTRYICVALTIVREMLNIHVWNDTGYRNEDTDAAIKPAAYGSTSSSKS